MISTPKRNVVGPRSRNLKWDASSLIAESMAAESADANVISSMKMGIMMRTSPQIKM